VIENFAAVRVKFSQGSPVEAAFDYLIAYAKAASFNLIIRTSAIRAVELQWPDRKLNPFAVIAQANHLTFYLRRPLLNAHASLFKAATAKFGSVKPNALGEYRTHLRGIEDVETLLGFLRQHGVWPSKRTDFRFPSETFETITGEHLLRAAQRLADGFTGHPFGPSTDYDLLFDGLQLPPKAVFGIAASEALGFPVRPANFSAGEGMTCFRMLREAGYQIVPKGQNETFERALISDEDRTWAEGQQRLVTHLQRERGAGLAQAKRDQFRVRHGHLYCERCNMNPVQTFGSDIGEACIEVHHRETQIGQMSEGHITRLEDLECLCANCHRVTHREIKIKLLLH
jgi:hypothetical protein